MSKSMASKGILSPFYDRNYRLLWSSEAFLGLADQMEFVVLVWFVLVETDSALMVGLFGALRWLGTLFAPVFGSVADRVDRRRMLIGTRLVFLIVAGAILAFTLTDRLTVWLVFICVGLGGVNRIADVVTRQSLLVDMVQESRLIRSVALIRLARDVTAMTGPLVAGALLTWIGMSQAYILITIMFLAAAVVSWRLRSQPGGVAFPTTSVWQNLSKVSGYVWKHQVLLAVLLFSLLINFAGFPLIFGLMPVFARDILGVDAMGLAVLFWAFWTGSFVGSFVFGALNRFNRPGRTVFFGTMLWFGTLLAFSQSHWLILCLGVLLVAGISVAFIMVNTDLILFKEATPEFRGRVMGARQLTIGGLPLGMLFTGFTADALGAPEALVINGFIGLALAVAIILVGRRLWHFG